MRNKCVKCLGPLSEGEFVVNKDMSYCDDCAALLHLGESKESKMFRDFQDTPEGENPSIPDYSGAPLEEEGAPIES